MSITARPSATFTAILTGAPNALGTTLTCGIRELPAGTMVSAAASTGIVETDVGSTSNYVATRTAPGDVTASYEVVWLVSGVEQVAEDLHVSGLVASESLTPDLDQVASVIDILDDGNNYLTTWSTTTNPTAAQVQAKVGLATRDVRRDVGPKLDTTDDEAFIASARDLAATRAAMYITERFAQQDTSDSQMYPLLKRLYDEGVRALRRRGGSASITLATPYSGDPEDLVA